MSKVNKLWLTRWLLRMSFVAYVFLLAGCDDSANNLNALNERVEKQASSMTEDEWKDGLNEFGTIVHEYFDGYSGLLDERSFLEEYGKWGETLSSVLTSSKTNAFTAGNNLSDSTILMMRKDMKRVGDVFESWKKKKIQLLYGVMDFIESSRTLDKEEDVCQ